MVNFANLLHDDSVNGVFSEDIDVLTKHERQPLWVQELTTNQLLKWQEVCKSIAR